MFYCARERRLALTRTLRSAATFWSSSPEGSAAPASVFNEIVLRAALRLRLHYMDLSSHLTKNPFKVEQFRYTKRFEEKNRRLPPKSSFSPVVFLQPRSGLVGCSEGLYLEERQNAKGMFRPEHCVWFSVLPR